MKALLVYRVECKGAKALGYSDGSQPFIRARRRVYKGLLSRHAPDVVLRHVGTIVNILNQAKSNALA